ncbi:MAG: hypothetical protein RIC03_04265 [Cyclobacteriaceae bacterium]
MKNMYYLFEVVKENEETPEEMLFSEEKYLWRKMSIERFSLVSFTFPDQEYHYFFDAELEFTPFHQGKEFISFLKEREVNHIQYDFASMTDEKVMVAEDGREFELRVAWISTGYEYAVYENGAANPLDVFQVPKSGKIELGDIENQTSIQFKHQGTAEDPVMKKAYKNLKERRKYGCVIGAVFIVLSVVALYYVGQLLNWLGGVLGF